MTTGERILFESMSTLLTVTINSNLANFANIIMVHFVVPEIEARNARGENWKLEDVWLVQTMLYASERPPDIRFNEEVRGDLRGRSKPFLSTKIGEISRCEIENLDIEDLDRITTRENEVGVSNVAFFRRGTTWYCSEFDVKQLMKYCAIHASAAGKRTCAASECENLLSSQRQIIYCSEKCGTGVRVKKHRQLLKKNVEAENNGYTDV